MVGVTCIEDNMRENRLSWFGHSIVDHSMLLGVVMWLYYGRARPKLTFEAVVRKDVGF